MAFAINIVLLGAYWAVLRATKLQRAGLYFSILATVHLSVFVLISPIVSDASVYASHASLNWYSSFEPGYVIFSKVVWAVWPNAKSLVIATNVIFLVSFAYFTNKYSEDVFLSYLLLVCFGYLSMSNYLLRQFLAFAFLFLAFDKSIQRKLVPFVIFVLLAASFHRTALFCLILYPLFSFKRNALYLVLVACFAAVFLIFGEQILEFATSFSRTTSALVSYTSGYGMLAFLVCVDIALWFSRSEYKKYSQMSLDVSVVFQLLALRYSTFVRVVYYFAMFLCFGLPNAINSINNSRMKLLAKAACIILAIVYYFVVLDCRWPGGSLAWYVCLP